jgi:hypothetical protein
MGEPSYRYLRKKHIDNPIDDPIQLDYTTSKGQGARHCTWQILFPQRKDRSVRSTAAEYLYRSFHVALVQTLTNVALYYQIYCT